MDAIDRAFQQEATFIAGCPDVAALLDRMADYRDDRRIAAQRGVTKARLRADDLLELAENRVAALKARALRTGGSRPERAEGSGKVRPPPESRPRNEVEDSGEVQRLRAELEQARAEMLAAERRREAAAEQAALREWTRSAELERLARERASRERAETERVALLDRQAATRRAQGPATARRAPHVQGGRPSATFRASQSSTVGAHDRSAPRAAAPLRTGPPSTGTPRQQGVAPPGTAASSPSAFIAPPTSAPPPGDPSVSPTAGRAESGAAPPVSDSKATLTPPSGPSPEAPTIPVPPLQGPATTPARSDAASENLIPAGPPVIYTGADLAKYRDEEGLSQRSAAQRLGVAHGTIAKAELEPAKPLGEALQAGLASMRAG